MLIIDLLAGAAIVATFETILRFNSKKDRLRGATMRCIRMAAPGSRALQIKVGFAADRLWFSEGLKALKRQLHRASGVREKRVLKRHIALLRCCYVAHLHAMHAFKRRAPWAMILFILHIMLE